MFGGHSFDVGYAMRHPVFLVTFIIAIPSWIIAFAGQCAAEAKYCKSLFALMPLSDCWHKHRVMVALLSLVHCGSTFGFSCEWMLPYAHDTLITY